MSIVNPPERLIITSLAAIPDESKTATEASPEISKLEGNVHAILLVVHNDEFDHVVSGIKHNFEDLITTHLHSKIEGEKCMELFVIDGEAERVSTITRDFQINKKWTQ